MMRNTVKFLIKTAMTVDAHMLHKYIFAYIWLKKTSIVMLSMKLILTAKKYLPK